MDACLPMRPVVLVEALTMSNPSLPERPTQKAVIACGHWLAACLRFGWRRDDLDSLEALWWKYHDRYGRLVKGAKNGTR